MIDHHMNEFTNDNSHAMLILLKLRWANALRGKRACWVIWTRPRIWMRWWIASRVDNVHHTERDYLDEIWIRCQFMGLYPHGVGLGFQIFPKLHTGRRVETVASHWRFKKNISICLQAERPFYSQFDSKHHLIIKHSFTDTRGHSIQHQLCSL